MNRKVFCTSAQHPVYFNVSSSLGQLYSLICDIHDNGRYRPSAARSTYPRKKNRVAQKSPRYTTGSHTTLSHGLGHLQFLPASVRHSCGAPVLQKLSSHNDDADKQSAISVHIVTLSCHQQLRV